MANYKVLVENFAAPLGDIVTDDQLYGVNIEALIESGVLKLETSKTKTDKE
jgi:hypothetical protein